MILYYNKDFFRLLTTWQGSVFFRRSSIIPGVLLSIFTALLAIFWDTPDMFAESTFGIVNNWAMAALGGSLTFAVVFRTQNGWQRYWEANTQLHFMYSKMADCFCQFHAFAVCSMEAHAKKDHTSKAATVSELVDTMEHSFIMLSAFAAHRLSNGDNQRMELRSMSLESRWKDRITTREELRVSTDTLQLHKTPPNFKSQDEVAEDEEQDEGHHGHGKSKTKNSGDVFFVCKHRLSTEEVSDLCKAKDRVNFCMYRILRLMSGCASDLTIPPPIQSRMYQELSNSMLGFSNALKVADVPFPLPFAQILSLLLVAWSIFVPIFVVNFTRNIYLGPIITFLIFEAVWCLNEVAKEIENPFGSDENDISLSDFHARFVDVLEDLTSPELGMIASKSYPHDHDHHEFVDSGVPGATKRMSRVSVSPAGVAAGHGHDSPPVATAGHGHGHGGPPAAKTGHGHGGPPVATTGHGHGSPPETTAHGQGSRNVDPSVDMHKIMHQVASDAQAHEPKREESKLVVRPAKATPDLIGVRLAQITEQMETHLVKIADELIRVSTLSAGLRASESSARSGGLPASASSPSGSSRQVTVEFTKEEAVRIFMDTQRSNLLYEGTDRSHERREQI